MAFENKSNNTPLEGVKGHCLVVMGQVLQVMWDHQDGNFVPTTIGFGMPNAKE